MPRISKKGPKWDDPNPALAKALFVRAIRLGGTFPQFMQAAQEVNRDGMIAQEWHKDAAEKEHLTDECEIDSVALLSEGDTGYWVSAWVYCEYPEGYNDEVYVVKYLEPGASDFSTFIISAEDEENASTACLEAHPGVTIESITDGGE